MTDDGPTVQDTAEPIDDADENEPVTTATADRGRSGSSTWPGRNLLEPVDNWQNSGAE
ncbi:hypothetical protein NDI56_09845 [Haloarcula sp. S1CR25-12]|uniref:Uncharacterized protein n=1 Tax=Haloarcula saliterrae TaxID=2950534 RepID=A0ABU2FBQ1_9EURY|nr:hypothetical protein [Haloarcula sp. S1CR25-12]MDS0259693.1 hypothetical protein [Haloarcula sp. S1CR25-12]